MFVAHTLKKKTAHMLKCGPQKCLYPMVYKCDSASFSTEKPKKILVNLIPFRLLMNLWIRRKCRYQSFLRHCHSYKHRTNVKLIQFHRDSNTKHTLERIHPPPPLPKHTLFPSFSPMSLFRAFFPVCWFSVCASCRLLKCNCTHRLENIRQSKLSCGCYCITSTRYGPFQAMSESQVTTVAMFCDEKQRIHNEMNFFRLKTEMQTLYGF